MKHLSRRRKLMRIILNKIDRGSQDKYLSQKDYFSTLIWHMETLADLLDQDLPNYKQDLENVKNQPEEIKLTEEQLEYWPYEDVEEMKFYKVFPDFDEAPKENKEQDPNSDQWDDFDTLTLGEVDSIQDIDDRTLEFISKFNNKNNRKRLARYIFHTAKSVTGRKGYLKTNFMLIRFYCRMVAILSQRHKEVKNELLKLLQKEHQELVDSQDLLKIQTKKKNIKFVCELAKFELCDSEIPLSRLKESLEDLNGHNPEIIFNLIESCGRYLMKKEQMEGFTKYSFNNMLDKLWEIKNQAFVIIPYGR